MKKYKCLPEKEAKAILFQLLSGIKYLHDHKNKIIHFDLKPQNILFHDGLVKISDFGLCKIMDSDATVLELTSQGVGTYWYLPPECFLIGDTPPKISPKVDIWSIGVIYYEMLFGMKPFGHGMTQEKIMKDQIILKATNIAFPLKSNVSNESREFIKKCLTYKQEERWDITAAFSSSFIQKSK